MKKFVIKELILDEDDDMSGIQAISVVDDPAIKEDFVFFNNQVKIDLRTTPVGVPLRDFYTYTSAPEPEIIDTSHDFCRHKAGHTYHISEINAWGNTPTATQKEMGFIEESNFFKTFQGNVGSFNVNQQIYNCRHWLRRVNSLDEIPTYKQKMKFGKEKKDNLEVEFNVSNKEKREIEGLVLQSGQFIYRNDLDGDPGYVFFTRKTVRQLQEKYGYNRNLTIQHQSDITGTAILLDSKLEEDEENNQTRWYLKYKIIDDSLWEAIKFGVIKGFSLEGLFSYKEH